MSSSSQNSTSLQKTKISKRSNCKQDVIDFRLVNGRLLVNGWCQTLVELGMMDCSQDCSQDCNQDCDTCWCG